MIIKLTVGDWSCDGHNQSSDFYIESSVDETEIELAYKKAVGIIGVDLTKDVCCDYECNSIRGYILDKLNQHLNLSKSKHINDFTVTPSGFVDLYIKYIKIGNPEIKIERKFDEVPSINIGGYGLYY